MIVSECLMRSLTSPIKWLMEDITVFNTLEVCPWSDLYIGAVSIPRGSFVGSAAPQQSVPFSYREGLPYLPYRSLWDHKRLQGGWPFADGQARVPHDKFLPWSAPKAQELGSVFVAVWSINSVAFLESAVACGTRTDAYSKQKELNYYTPGMSCLQRHPSISITIPLWVARMKKLLAELSIPTN
ncbi:hypothetical protein OPV22_018581 [Ensete ventricosum]|uniref:Uncharacterized protein n=1 Tax=Ensete ventricosum TaxID=4639 RepID=A0AAV8PJ60_ENSVE|nr:hypothetical protein OPV22_018581 [Ensete ventricosum]